ncbi:uncharacterized protein LOC127122138 [Lathyrus oleraceus]|uniref:uncharacterized protein LOC127122138 n=1 Tax=Pisum sativum TaxID=3888 RepID=UPI0021CE609B|nr:uncharacterized protein LOC127122138 [Pisum sativum]
MTKNCNTALPQTMTTKLKDPGKFTISCTISGVEIPLALCDLGLSIIVITLNKEKELNLRNIILSNMTLTLVDLYITHPHGILQDVLVNVDGLVFPADFMVVNMKGDTGGSIILGRPFLATRKALIDVEIRELSLKFNKEKMVFNVYEWTPYVDDLDTCYQIEEKGGKFNKGKNKG